MCHTCVQCLLSIWEFLFPTKKMINSGFFYGKKSMSPLTADDVFKNSTPKSSCQKKMFTVFLSKKKSFPWISSLYVTPQMTFVWRSLVKTSTILVRWGPPNVWALTLENSGTDTMGSDIFWNRIWIRDCLKYYEIFFIKQTKQFN